MNANACITDIGIPLNVRNQSGRHDSSSEDDAARGKRTRQQASEGIHREPGCSEGPKQSRGEELVWVVATGCQVVGTIRLAANGSGDPQVRRVRIDPEWRHTSVASGLIDQVRAFCERSGYARIEFEPGSAPFWFQALAERRGFGDLNSSY
jgi:hypothetical protein